MPSALQTSLNILFQDDYMAVVVLTVIGYDYVLTLPNEIEYIWIKSWTWVSTLFIFVRYSGLFAVMSNSVVGSSFLPHGCEVLWVTDIWALALFTGSADLMMLLRVWAMYNRSRPVLITLLALFSLEIITFVMANVINSNPKTLLAYDSQILGYSFCEAGISRSPVWAEITTFLQVTNGAAMCILAIVRCTRELLRTYRMAKRLELNRYMDLLVRQGVFYFAAMVTLQLFNVLNALGMVPKSGWRMVLTYIVQFVPAYTLTPRFIISMRELYARDVRRTDGIDSAFGLSSSLDGAAGRTITISDIEQNEDEEISMEATRLGGETNQQN